MSRQYEEISHFRAPYKNAMMSGVGDPYSGYGVYESAGDAEEDKAARGGEELNSMWGQNPWAEGQGGQRGMWGKSPWNGVGDVTSPVPPVPATPADPALPPPPPLSSLDPLFTMNGGITFATPATAAALTATMTQWAATDPAFAVPDALGQTISVVVYHGMAQPPPGSEPGPYTPLATLLASMLPAAGDHVAMLIDKYFAMPTPGKRTLIFTRNAQVIAANAKSGGAYFLTPDADAVLVAQAKAMVGSGVLSAGFFTSPMGMVTTAIVIGGVVYLMSMGGKKTHRRGRAHA
jgi:hypothetical protein